MPTNMERTAVGGLFGFRKRKPRRQEMLEPKLRALLARNMVTIDPCIHAFRCEHRFALGGLAPDLWRDIGGRP
jgi:hypothetical protein